MKSNLRTLFVAVLAFAIVPLAQAVEPLDKFSVRAGTYLTNFDTKVRADGDTTAGTEVDFSRDFGLSQDNGVAYAGLTWRPWTKHEFTLGYFQDDGSATRQINRNIEFDGTLYELNSTVRARQDMEVIDASYTYWVVQRDTWTLGPRVGLVWYKLALGLEVEVDAAGNVTGGTASTEVEADLPAPSIGAGWRWTPGNSDWRLSADLGYFSADVDDIDAGVTTGRAGVEWYPSENWGLWTDYTVRRIDVSSNRDRFNGNLNFVDQGVRIGAAYRF